MFVLLVSTADPESNTGYHYQLFSSFLESQQIPHAIVLPFERQPEPLTYFGHETLTFNTAIPYLHALATKKILVHLWPCRPPTRAFALRLSAHFPVLLIAHFEDDEFLLDENVQRKTGTPSLKEFLPHCRGATYLNRRQATIIPPYLRSIRLAVPYDPGFFIRQADPDGLRTRYGIPRHHTLTVYNGSVNEYNLRDYESLCRAIAQIRESGVPVSLIKTGRNAPGLNPTQRFDGCHDVGEISRNQVRELLSASDFFVLTGEDVRYNQYRFPSKIPEWIQAKRPILLSSVFRGLDPTFDAALDFYEPSIAGDLIERILRLITDQDWRDCLRERVEILHATRFSDPYRATETLHMYQSLTHEDDWN